MVLSIPWFVYSVYRRLELRRAGEDVSAVPVGGGESETAAFVMVLTRECCWVTDSCEIAESLQQQLQQQQRLQQGKRKQKGMGRT